MKRMLIVPFALLLTFLLVSCSQGDTAQDQEPTQETNAIVLSPELSTGLKDITSLDLYQIGSVDIRSFSQEEILSKVGEYLGEQHFVDAQIKLSDTCDVSGYHLYIDDTQTPVYLRFVNGANEQIKLRIGLESGAEEYIDCFVSTASAAISASFPDLESFDDGAAVLKELIKSKAFGQVTVLKQIDSWSLQYYNNGSTLSLTITEEGEEQKTDAPNEETQKDETAAPADKYSTLTDADKRAICDYIQDRYDYYDSVNSGYAGDKYSDTIYQEAADKYGLTTEQIGIIWSNSYSYGSSSSTEVNTARHDEDMICICAQDIVKQYLPTPSTAKFCKWSEMVKQDLGNGHYQCAGWVDAQNEYGAMIRYDFLVYYTATEEGYKEGGAELFPHGQ